MSDFNALLGAVLHKVLQFSYAPTHTGRRWRARARAAGMPRSLIRSNARLARRRIFVSLTIRRPDPPPAPAPRREGEG